MAPWLRVLETYLIQALLRTPAFHRGVEKVAHRVHRFRNGLPPEQPGGTHVDDPNKDGKFFQHFSEEIQTQLGRAERRSGREQVERVKRRSVPEDGENADAAWRASREDEVRRTTVKEKKAETSGADAEEAWRQAGRTGYEGSGPEPRRGFLGEYIGALREQMRNGK